MIRDILQSNDADSKGYLTVDELADSLQALGFTPDDDDVEFLVKHMDDDGEDTNKLYYMPCSEAVLSQGN